MPAFEIDRQTIDDLGIFTEAGSANSIFSFFDHVKTIGGQKN